MNQITAIIPTYNRPAYLRRLLTYFENVSFEGNIIVADSSKENHKLENNETVNSINIDNIYIFKYSCNIKLSEKIYQAFRKVDTEYIVLCADDDFITQAGIEHAVVFLNEHPQFSSAHGHYITFTAAQSGDEIQFSWQPSYLDSRTISSLRPERRVYEHLANYVPTFYAVHRTAEIERAYKRAVEATDDVRFRELLPSLLTMVNGKFKHLDVLYGARYASEQLGQRADNMRDFIKQGTFQLKYDRFRQTLAERLVAATDLSISDVIEIINRGMVQYLSDKYDFSVEAARHIVAGTPISALEDGQTEDEQNLPNAVMVRDRLATTPMPDRLISVMESTYWWAQNVPQHPVVKSVLAPDSPQQKLFYLMVDPPLSRSTDLERIVQTVRSHPNAINE